MLFIPGLTKLKVKRAASPRARAFALASGTVCLSGMLFILISGGVAVYSEYASQGFAPNSQSLTQGTGVPATVAIVKDADGVYDNAQLDQMVRNAVALAGGLGPVMVDRRGGGASPWNAPDGDVDVIIIPNMSGTQPGLNTDPRVTHTVVDMAWEAGATSVKFGGAATGSNLTAFVLQGYDVNSDGWLDYDPRVPMIDLNDTGTTGACAGQRQYNNVTQITLPTNGVGAAVARSSYYVHNELLKTDVMIVVPAIKNHNLGTITQSLKMRIGTAPQDLYFAPWLGCGDEPFLRWEMHNWNQTTKYPWNIGGAPASEPEAVQRSLVDLNLVRPHDFTVVDALVGCEAGPLNYDEPTTRVKSIMASRDALAIDAIGALVMGYNPDQIPCLNMANDTQVLGVKDRRLITVVGDHVKNVRVDFRLDHPTGYATPYRTESINPAITGISLTEGQSVPANAVTVVTCSGVADNTGVIKAEVFVDGALEQIVTDPTSSFNFNLDTTGFSAGSHEVKVTVYDAAMNEASITRNVTVQVVPGPFISVAPVAIGRTIEITQPLATDVIEVTNTGTDVMDYTVQADQPWLVGFPVAGTSAGEQDAIPVNYATANLTPGDHVGTLTITSPTASNSPRTVTVTITVEPVAADLSADGDVDQSDFGRLQVCLGQPGVAPPIGCEAADLDDDGDVDQDDFGIMQACFSGAGILADPTCDD